MMKLKISDENTVYKLAGDRIYEFTKLCITIFRLQMILQKSEKKTISFNIYI